MALRLSRIARRLSVPLLLGFAFFSFADRADAEVDKVERRKDGDYFEFVDDLLNSDVSQPSGGRITVRPPARRVMLIRPRTSFVMEMFKSVEAI